MSAPLRRRRQDGAGRDRSGFLRDTPLLQRGVERLPEHPRRRLRTSNPMERAIQQEIKRRTIKVRVFPNEASLERLVSAILVEIDDKWATADKAYIKWQCQDD